MLKRSSSCWSCESAEEVVDKVAKEDQAVEEATVTDIENGDQRIVRTCGAEETSCGEKFSRKKLSRAEETSCSWNVIKKEIYQVQKKQAVVEMFFKKKYIKSRRNKLWLKSLQASDVSRGYSQAVCPKLFYEGSRWPGDILWRFKMTWWYSMKVQEDLVTF